MKMWTLKQWLKFDDYDSWDKAKKEFNKHHGEGSFNNCIEHPAFENKASGKQDYEAYKIWFALKFTKLGQALS